MRPLDAFLSIFRNGTGNGLRNGYRNHRKKVEANGIDSQHSKSDESPEASKSDESPRPVAEQQKLER